MLENSFTLLREIGSFALRENEEIRFSIDAYRGYRYVSVRRYLRADGFSGATRDGITLTPEIARALQERLQALPDDWKALPNGVVGKFAKRPGICVVAAVASFRGARGLDLRQTENDKLTKKGIWIALEKWAEVKKMFAATVAVLDEVVPDLDDF